MSLPPRPPPKRKKLNFELLKEKSRTNEKDCAKAVLQIVILEYSLYSKLWCLDPGIENLE